MREQGETKDIRIDLWDNEGGISESVVDVVKDLPGLEGTGVADYFITAINLLTQQAGTGQLMIHTSPQGRALAVLSPPGQMHYRYPGSVTRLGVLKAITLHIEEQG